jgi:hypothetical protein
MKKAPNLIWPNLTLSQPDLSYEKGTKPNLTEHNLILI